MNKPLITLPPGFPKWRPHQKEIAEKIAGSNKFCRLVDAPTGSGKSLIGVASGQGIGDRTVYTVKTKQLQDQLLSDFPDLAKELKGRANYPCARWPWLFPEITAADCIKSRKHKECEMEHRCEYENRKREAARASLAVLNQSYFLLESNHGKSFRDIPLLVTDEIDSLEDTLMETIQFTVTRKQLNRLDIPPPQDTESLEAWIEWIEPTMRLVGEKIIRLEERIDEDNPDPYEVKELNELYRFHERLANFAKARVNESWVWYPEEEKWTFKPVKVAPYTDAYLWEKAENVLGMSATILDPDQLASDLGLESEDLDYFRLESQFPVENRPIYYRPVANLTKRTMNEELPKLAKEVERIIKEYPDSKILCHTVSYKVRDYLMDNVKSNRLMTHNSEDRAAKLEEFKASEGAAVMLSPSFDRGVDLPYENCQVCIVCKCPFPYLGDPQISKRVKLSDGWQWYRVQTLRTLIQMTGRSVRAIDDTSTIFILDRQFERLMSQTRNITPKWWLDAVYS